MKQTATIYVALVDEGVDVWRPVAAKELEPGCYLLEGAMPADEEWAFRPGQVVACELRSFSDGVSGLVATKLTAQKSQ